MIKSVTCRAGETEWQLVRLERPDFERVSKQIVVGHPAYYRVVPVDNTGDYEVSGGYEVWPRPAVGVEVIPRYED